MNVSHWLVTLCKLIFNIFYFQHYPLVITLFHKNSIRLCKIPKKYFGILGYWCKKIGMNHFFRLQTNNNNNEAFRGCHAWYFRILGEKVMAKGTCNWFMPNLWLPHLSHQPNILKICHKFGLPQVWLLPEPRMVSCGC
jgi:hypothetical protein